VCELLFNFNNYLFLVCFRMNYANATPEGVPIGVWQSVVGEVARDLSWTDQGAYLAVEPFLKSKHLSLINSSFNFTIIVVQIIN